ncbi:MAG: hypothetical protein M3O22_06595 [Pseudomonadota bacterium]|nr:hypothetical protein [Pseudomonadota bacterium]
MTHTGKALVAGAALLVSGCGPEKFCTDEYSAQYPASCGSGTPGPRPENNVFLQVDIENSDIGSRDRRFFVLEAFALPSDPVLVQKALEGIYLGLTWLSPWKEAFDEFQRPVLEAFRIENGMEAVQVFGKYAVRSSGLDVRPHWITGSDGVTRGPVYTLGFGSAWIVDSTESYGGLKPVFCGYVKPSTDWNYIAHALGTVPQGYIRAMSGDDVAAHTWAQALALCLPEEPKARGEETGRQLDTKVYALQALKGHGNFSAIAMEQHNLSLAQALQENGEESPAAVADMVRTWRYIQLHGGTPEEAFKKYNFHQFHFTPDTRELEAASGELEKVLERIGQNVPTVPGDPDRFRNPVHRLDRALWLADWCKVNPEAAGVDVVTCHTLGQIAGAARLYYPAIP